jgi:hypothetical protein
MRILRRLIFFLVIFATHFAAETSVWGASRQAVLVGVGKYHPDTIDRADLDGPPNDITIMRRILKAYGFDDDNTTVLIDRDATRQSILDAVDNKLMTQPKESLAVFYFSGHGSALRSRNGVGEFNDETIVPYDGRVRGRPYADIIDDEIYAWIRGFERKGIAAVLIFDSCLSGGAARPGIEVRRMPGVQDERRSTTDGVLTFRHPDRLTTGAPIVVLTASAASDFAYSKTDPGTGVVRGTFTGALQTVLLPDGPTPPPITWKGVSEAVKNLLTGGSAESMGQIPQFFGAKDSKVFAGGTPFSSAVPARRIGADRLILQRGSAFGITQGSVFKLFNSTQVPWRMSEDFAALARVSKVYDDQAELSVEKGKLELDDYGAVELEYAVPKVRTVIKIPTGTFKDKGDARAVQDVVDELQADGPQQAGTAELVVSATRQAVQLTTTDGRPVGAPIELLDSVTISDELRRRFASFARWQRLFDWRRPGIRWRGISYRIEYQVNGNKVVLAGRDLQNARIPAGATIALAVSNAGSQVVSAIAILMRQDFSIDVCPAGRIQRNKENATERVVIGPSTGAAAWKLIISDPTQAMDLDFLKTGGSTRSPKSSQFGDEFSAVWNGAASASSRSIGANEPEWQAFDIPFNVVSSSDMDAKLQSTAGCLGFPEK